ncbi:hypothetical protein [Vallitalea maricola]
MNDAFLGHTEIISRESPFPSGWVVISCGEETKTIKYMRLDED